MCIRDRSVGHDAILNWRARATGCPVGRYAMCSTEVAYGGCVLYQALPEAWNRYCNRVTIVNNTLFIVWAHQVRKLCA
eukprot:3768927-Rhodomonas_salina.1